MAIGTLILLIVGLLVSYYCLRNQFMVSQSLVFINFSIFASWWIIYLLYPEYGVEAIIDLGFKSQYIAEPQFYKGAGACYQGVREDGDGCSRVQGEIGSGRDPGCNSSERGELENQEGGSGVFECVQELDERQHVRFKQPAGKQNPLTTS